MVRRDQCHKLLPPRRVQFSERLSNTVHDSLSMQRHEPHDLRLRRRSLH